MEFIVRPATPNDREQLDRFPSAIAFRLDHFLVVVREESVVAFLAWRELVPGESEILQLETAPPYRRRGLARRLLGELKTERPGSLFLEVRASNEAARQLYNGEGFHCLAVRRQYYSTPPEDGIVLKFHS